MGKIVLISDSIRDRSEYLSNCTLPQNYMGDFTVMGFVVNRYSDSRSLLESAGYQLIEKCGVTTIIFDNHRSLLDIKALIAAHGIRCTYLDIADCFYQA